MHCNYKTYTYIGKTYTYIDSTYYHSPVSQCTGNQCTGNQCFTPVMYSGGVL